MWVDDLAEQDNRILEHPQLYNYLLNTREGDKFVVDNCILTTIETPGHIKDHLCFLLEEPGESTYMFTGDHIIQADSVLQ